MSNSVVDQALNILVAGQDFTSLRRALFATVAGHYLESESSVAPQPDQENYKVFALNALLARLPTCSLAAVTTIAKGKTGIKDAVPGPFPLVVTAEARGSSDHFDFEGPGVMIPMVSSTGHGDASLKRVHFQDGQYAVGSILAVVQPKDTQQLSARYLHAYLSTFKDELLVSRMVGTANVSLTVAKIGDVPVPLLPISAQRRVDELMALCDRLEAQQADAESAHAQLVQTLLDSLTQASDTIDFAANWQRLAEHFHTLFTTESSIDALKQTVLQLAVMGKLVQQDPSDEPASELLARVELQNHLTANPSRSKKPKQEIDAASNIALFELPMGWAIARVSQTGEIKLGRQRSPKDHFGEHMVPYLRVANVKENSLDLSDVKEMNFTPAEQEIFRLLPGDVLLNEGQSKELVGRPAIFNGEIPGVCFQNTLLRFRAYDCVIPIYALRYFQSCMHSGRFQQAAQQTTNIAHLSASRLAAIEFPLPPVPEQHRIIAKIDQLMALCDQLKTRLTKARQLNEQLATALVEKAVA
ncbi:MAG: restriction endonuclease subunit S [Pseudomonadales bacterium]